MADPMPNDKRQPVVMVVDDTHDSRQLLVSMLRRFTHAEVIEAVDGVQALNLFISKRPCITFLDIDMPGADGLSALGEIRKVQGDAFVTMVTGMCSASNVNASLQQGASGFVVKPYSARRIIDCLMRYEQLGGQGSLMRDKL
jgi:two-component system, chemotaxis family, chemotaxis protein CheY